MNDGNELKIGTPDELRAVAEVRKAAADGNPEAMFRLGVMYGNADGVPLDQEEAARCFMQAAQRGHEGACISLAWMYANGAGVEVDETKARDLYEIAARHGSAKAQYVVGNMYRFAQYGVECDIGQALDWYRRAAGQNMPTAQFALGKMAMEGRHVAQDDAVALEWFSLAHVNGSKRAEEYIEELVKRMPPDLVREIQARFQAPPVDGDG